VLEAVADLHRRGVPFVLALAGEGSAREALERRAAELGVAAQVRFVGVPGDLGPLLGAADLVIQPSAASHVPGPLLQALARARPVVAVETGGVTELIEDGLNGRLVPPGDAGALADAIEGAYRRSDAARRMASHGALRVRDEFSWPRVVETYEEVYDEVLGLASFEPEHDRVVREGR
jgi:glycosyltransferase involved in cell wall biosynthesis